MNRLQKLPATPAPQIDVNLFSGAGGFALGMRLAGVPPTYLYEIDRHGQATCRGGKLIGANPPGWERHEGDVRKVDWAELGLPVRILAAGVPCQPFSRGGKHEAQADSRNLFPEALRAIRELEPRAVVIENVHGLMRPGFSQYLGYILRCLECPDVTKKPGERWPSHNRRLRERQTAKGFEPAYSVKCEQVNAADFGVAQVRRRVFIVALRRGEVEFEFPQPTHSEAALIRDQFQGRYWDRWSIRPRLRHRMKDLPDDDGLTPWVTVRDAISGLPAPALDAERAELDIAVPNHWAIDGARRYSGHNGSDLDWPSKTIKAGVHGVPGGENTVRHGHKFRYYTLREAALIQSFPVDYKFEGARMHVTRQIGNAVPPALSRAISAAVLRTLSRRDTKETPVAAAGPKTGRRADAA